jgi:hypothetical protein
VVVVDQKLVVEEEKSACEDSVARKSIVETGGN